MTPGLISYILKSHSSSYVGIKNKTTHVTINPHTFCPPWGCKRELSCGRGSTTHGSSLFLLACVTSRFSVSFNYVSVKRRWGYCCKQSKFINTACLDFVSEYHQRNSSFWIASIELYSLYRMDMVECVHLAHYSLSWISASVSCWGIHCLGSFY